MQTALELDSEVMKPSITVSTFLLVVLKQEMKLIQCKDN